MITIESVDLKPLLDFLPCKTPDVWTKNAIQHIDILLIDHANCEKKAAATAMNLLFKYTDVESGLPQKMSQLAREELLHYEQVLDLMKARNITYNGLSPSRYCKIAKALTSIANTD